MKTKLPILDIAFGLLLVVLNVVIYFYATRISIISLIMTIMIVALYISKIVSEKKRREIAVEEVAYYVDKHGADLFTNMPVGIISINASGIIKWVNKFIELQYEDSLEMRSIDEVFPGVMQLINDEDYDKDVIVEINERSYQVIAKDGGLFFFDKTDCIETNKRYMDNRSVIGIINFDNYDDYISSLDDQRASDVTLHMSKLINKWCERFDIYLKRYTNNRYLLITKEEVLEQIKQDKFSILDDIRLYGTQCKLPLTLSISMAHEIENVEKLAELAFEGIELVLSRGGDQAVVKSQSEKSEFFGGKTDAFEKRNRAKTRMFAGSVANLVRKSKNVVIMGHDNPDFDSIGGCVGMSKLALSLTDNVCVALDTENMNTSSAKLLKELEDTKFHQLIKSPEEALELMTRETLLIVVDTHKRSLVASQQIVDKSRNTIVIDHHRRGDDFIANPIASYVEPYASSTSELVTELFEFQSEKVEISALEASAMLAGIIMDTKHFVYRTGNRTFAAAAKLKTMGADTILIQDLLKEELEKVVLKNDLISRIEIVGNNCAVTYLDDSVIISRNLLAQTADEIMTIEKIAAAFVVGSTGDGGVALSARSLGEVNVQVIAEKFSGGGHLTAAAVQLDDMSVGEFVNKLKDVIKGGYDNESNLSR